MLKQMHIHYWEVPSQQALVWPTIQALSATKRPATINEIVAYFKENFPDAEQLFSVFYAKRPNVSVFRDRISRSCRTAEKLGFTKRVRRGAYDLSPQGEALFYLSETSAEECVREAVHTLHPNTAIMSRQTSSLQEAKTLQREVGELLHNQKKYLDSQMQGVGAVLADLQKMPGLSVSPALTGASGATAQIRENLASVVAGSGLNGRDMKKYLDSQMQGVGAVLADLQKMPSNAATMEKLADLSSTVIKTWNVTLPRSPLGAIEDAFSSLEFKNAVTKLLEDVSEPAKNDTDTSIPRRSAVSNPVLEHFALELDDVRNVSKREKTIFTVEVLSYLCTVFRSLIEVSETTEPSEILIEITFVSIIFLCSVWGIFYGIEKAVGES